MERLILERQFERAGEHVLRGEILVVKQRKRLALLERQGLDTAKSRKLLSQLEELQAMHVADLDRVRHELEETPPKGSFW